MANYNNEQLANWQQPISGSEDETIKNVVSMVRDAINASSDLKDFDIEVFLQGSYANNTNVKQNSDVDINVCLKTTFYYKLPEGRTKDQYNISDSSYSYLTFKTAVYNAMVAKFGRENVQRKNKCIHIKENTYHHEADVVPTFEYRKYGYSYVQARGVKFLCDDLSEIINFPKQQVANGTTKNNDTGRRYKRTARILKRVRYKMQDERVSLNSNISSFLIESLLWNVPNYLYDEDDLNERLSNILVYLYSCTTSDVKMRSWNEESDMLPLFSSDRKWTITDVQEFIIQVWKYLGYSNE